MVCEDNNHEYYIGAVNQKKVVDDYPRADSIVLFCKKCGKVITMKINYGG